VIEHLSSEVDFGNSWRGEGRGMFGWLGDNVIVS
jgi:hypothetical protein